MKKLTKLRIKYLLIIICLLIILGIIFPTFMRYYVSVTANIVGYAKETRTSTYKIKFHNNGGEGTMDDMTMNYDESQNLTKNTFTREHYNFGGWNTEADGSGTYYVDEQEIINTTYVTGNEINLYEQWTENIFYIVEYNANGGIGNIESQMFEYGFPQRLKPNTFTKEDYSFLHWNTEADGTGTTYEDEEEVNNLTDVNGEIVTLYAIYAREKYINNNDIVFDGTNYIDTGVCLFSEKNINKDFEVSFEIKERGTTAQYATIMSAMDESGRPWPGIVYRMWSTTQEQCIANNGSSSIDKKYNFANIQKVTLKRICGVLYVSFNDGQDTELVDLSKITTPFDVPVTFGASLDGNKNPFRYFTGTLSNLKVILTDPISGTIKFDRNGGTGTEFTQMVTPNTTVNLTKNTYTRVGYEFNGWNTKANGTGTSYADRESVTNIITSEGQTVTLYAQWKTYNYTVQFDANGGTGSMEIQEFESTVAQQLNTNTFTKEGYSFAFWNTAANGSGKTYQDEEAVLNLATSNGAVVKLYAIYECYNYEHEGDFVFDGTNYINTNIYLFSQKNVNKDFEISFEIKDCVSTVAFATLMNSVDESGSPYPGFVFRINKNGSQYELEANSIKGPEKNFSFELDSVTKVELRRVSGVLYMKINDGEEQQVIDYATLKKLFYVPVYFGASLDGKFTPQRYFTGTLSNIRVTLYE